MKVRPEAFLLSNFPRLISLTGRDSVCLLVQNGLAAPWIQKFCQLGISSYVHTREDMKKGCSVFAWIHPLAFCEANKSTDHFQGIHFLKILYYYYFLVEALASTLQGMVQSWVSRT